MYNPVQAFISQQLILKIFHPLFLVPQIPWVPLTPLAQIGHSHLCPPIPTILVPLFLYEVFWPCVVVPSISPDLGRVAIVLHTFRPLVLPWAKIRAKNRDTGWLIECAGQEVKPKEKTEVCEPQINGHIILMSLVHQVPD